MKKQILIAALLLFATMFIACEKENQPEINNLEETFPYKTMDEDEEIILPIRNLKGEKDSTRRRGSAAPDEDEDPVNPVGNVDSKSEKENNSNKAGNEDEDDFPINPVGNIGNSKG
jgi:hypothetical protein